MFNKLKELFCNILVGPKKETESTYIKPYISVEKHGENGKLFEDNYYDDRYIRNKGRNYH